MELQAIEPIGEGRSRAYRLRWPGEQRPGELGRPEALKSRTLDITAAPAARARQKISGMGQAKRLPWLSITPPADGPHATWQQILLSLGQGPGRVLLGLPFRAFKAGPYPAANRPRPAHAPPGDR